MGIEIEELEVKQIDREKREKRESEERERERERDIERGKGAPKDLGTLRDINLLPLVITCSS